MVTCRQKSRSHYLNQYWLLTNDTFNNSSIWYYQVDGFCKEDVTPLLTHWNYVFLALTHRSGDSGISTTSRCTAVLQDFLNHTSNLWNATINTENDDCWQNKKINIWTRSVFSGNHNPIHQTRNQIQQKHVPTEKYRGKVSNSGEKGWNLHRPVGEKNIEKGCYRTMRGKYYMIIWNIPSTK